jgi:hypothetical protein
LRRIIGAVIAAALMIFIAGCGATTGGGTGPVPTATQPVGPAAPPAARGQETGTRATAESVAGAAVFLRASGGKFESISLPLAKVSLLRAGAPAVSLQITTNDQIASDSCALIAHGTLPVGQYDGLALQPAKNTTPAIVVAAGRPSKSLRLPETLDLKFDAVKTSATEHLVLVLTLDCKGLTGKAPIEVPAERFSAGLLGKEEAGTVKGRVAPSSSLGHVYACWAKGGTVVAATQADAFTGDYTLTGLPAGEYVVRIAAAGYNTYQGPEKPIVAAAGKTVDLPPAVLVSSFAAPGM